MNLFRGFEPQFSGWATVPRSEKKGLVAILVLVAVIILGFPPATQAQAFNVIYNFTGQDPDEGNPRAGLVLGRTGAFYGTTQDGNAGAYPGTIFKLEKLQGNWTLTTLHKFNPQTGYDPADGLFIGPGDVLYGALAAGGNTAGDCNFSGCGSVFQFVPPAAVCRHPPCSGETTLHLFGGGHDGLGSSRPTLASNGNLYGTTSGGDTGQGQIYELAYFSGQWVKNTIHSFGSRGDGVSPSSGLAIDSTGSLLGFTIGNNGVGCDGSTVAYKLTPGQAGWSQQIVHCFLRSEGFGEDGVPLLDSNGNLYGTMHGGGADENHEEGTVFELSPVGNGWVLSRLYSFVDGPFGGSPVSSLIQDQAGNLYGTRNQGGKYLGGVVFRLSPTDNGWTYTSLHDFAGGLDDGEYPDAPVVFGKDGYLYGTTSSGGSSGVGVIFRIIP